MKKARILNLIIMALIGLSFTTQLFAQNTKATFKEANGYYKDEHYRKAIPLYEEVLKSEPNNAQALLEVGICYLHRYSKDKALEYIYKAYKIDSTVNKHMHYWMGRVHQQNYEFDKAILHYNIYKSGLRKKDQRHKDLNKHIEETERAREFQRNAKNYMVKNLGPMINSSASEHSPVTSQNDSLLMFTSRRESASEGKEDLDGEPFEDVFQSRLLPNGEWTHPESIHLNTTGHDASIQLFDNDSKLFIYKFTRGGDIYVTEKQGDKWGDPQQFANINTRDYEADAFITADGKTVYFATNHYKKVGDLDIYYVTKNDDGTWTKPQELKGNINTDQDEDAPFISPDGNTMYFSSRGHKGIGGFDIYMTKKDANGKWSQPENMGHPINTPDDDVYYYQTSNPNKGYVASYRDGGYGEKDIYLIQSIPHAMVAGKVTEDSTGNPVPDAKIIFTSLTNTTTKSTANENVKDGAYKAQVMSYNKYKVSIVKGNDTLTTTEVDIPVVDNEDQIVEKNFTIPYKPSAIAIAKVDTATKIINNTSATASFMKVVNFATNSYKLDDESKAILDEVATLMKADANKALKVDVAGHTDAIGSDAYNLSLSKKRAKAVADYLKSKGIKSDKVLYNGYGEANPIDSNDTVEGRAKNRRTEVKSVAK